ncbi:MAG: 4-oxalomesaconate tautomerase [Geminicoccus sp.]|nr:4-oxalomesaconate tautomerase [Geminicoccus sp.]
MSDTAAAGDAPGPETGEAKRPLQPEPQHEPRGVRCLWMRGGTSKGGYFLADDLPADTAARDAFLLRVMGSPDPLQIDGMGGGDPLRSKVAVVRPSTRSGVDVDYLFLQVMVDQAIVTDAQNCGNILAGVGPFAIERGLISAQDGETPVTIYMENTGQTAQARVQTPARRVAYAGATAIDGVPGTAAAIPLLFSDTAGSSCGALLPTGMVTDRIDGVDCTLIDNGMPCVIMDAADFGLSGQESREALDANTALKARLEAIRLQVGPMMNLGDVTEKSVPKMTLVSPPARGGAINTRSFIPHRCHATIGVLAAVTVATAATLPGSPAHRLAVMPEGTATEGSEDGQSLSLAVGVEQPGGITEAALELDSSGAIARAGIVRTARKLMDGEVF